MFKFLARVSVISCMVFAASATLASQKHEAAVRSIVDAKVMPWIASAEIVSAIKAQNAKHASLSEGDVVKLDKQWRAETKTGSKPLIDSVLKNALSGFLKQKKAESKGMFTEIFVMDDKGLNVGQSDITSDYWQGDEAKWQKSYKAGAGAVFVDKVTRDESTQRFQTQVSVAIADPATKQVIGAITIGIDMEAAGM